MRVSSKLLKMQQAVLPDDDEISIDDISDLLSDAAPARQNSVSNFNFSQFSHRAHSSRRSVGLSKK